LLSLAQEIELNVEQDIVARGASKAASNHRKKPNMNDEHRMTAYQLLLIK